jgi:multiple sugar transport system permease protein
MIYPYLWSFSSSFKTDRQIYNGNPLDLVPNPAITENYTDALARVPFFRFLENSLFLSLVVPGLSMVISVLAAYAFARLEFKGRNIVFLFVLGTMMLPGHITLIPRFIMMRYLGWINTYWALIIPSAFGGMAVFNTFLLRQFFLSFPKELEEAAIIDGCSRWQILLKILLPNSTAALATVAIISFKNEWNAFLWPLVVINDLEKMPIQVGLSFFQNGVSGSWGTLLAGAVMALVPLIIVFIIFQRYFISSTVTTGLAGK